MSRMIALISTVVLILAFGSGAHAFAAEPENKEAKAAALKAATAWLELVDEGSYGQSWDQAAGLFKRAVTKEQWRTQITAIRPPLGKVVSRVLDSARYTESLPGVPDGEYVVIQYRTEFENKKSALETITPLADPDGVWRVAGYFIR